MTIRMRKKIIFLIASFFIVVFWQFDRMNFWSHKTSNLTDMFDFVLFIVFVNATRRKIGARKVLIFVVVVVNFISAFDDWDSTRTHCQSAFASFFLVFTFLKHFFYDMSSPIIFSRVCKFAVWGWIQSTKPERKSYKV